MWHGLERKIKKHLLVLIISHQGILYLFSRLWKKPQYDVQIGQIENAVCLFVAAVYHIYCKCEIYISLDQVGTVLIQQ